MSCIQWHKSKFGVEGGEKTPRGAFWGPKWHQKVVFGPRRRCSEVMTLVPGTVLSLLVARVNDQKALLGGLAVGRRSWTGLGFQWQTW